MVYTQVTVYAFTDAITPFLHPAPTLMETRHKGTTAKVQVNHHSAEDLQIAQNVSDDAFL